MGLASLLLHHLGLCGHWVGVCAYGGWLLWLLGLLWLLWLLWLLRLLLVLLLVLVLLLLVLLVLLMLLLGNGGSGGGSSGGILIGWLRWLGNGSGGMDRGGGNSGSSSCGSRSCVIVCHEPSRRGELKKEKETRKKTGKQDIGQRD